MRAAIGIGANLGDRLATMREAVERLSRVSKVVARSRVYETAPVGGPPQGDYLNAVVLVQYKGQPLALLDELLRIEAELGRERYVRWGPRTVDLDLLWIDGVVVEHPRLFVPHPRLTERAFALVPLLEVAPAARDPRTGDAYHAPRDATVRVTDDLV